MFLGDDAFIERSLRYARRTDDAHIPKAQRRAPPRSLEAIASEHDDCDAAIVAAHWGWRVEL